MTASANGVRGRSAPAVVGTSYRDAIVASARRIATESGYTGLTIRAVAAAVPTTPVTIYRHFGSKDGLARALMAEWAAETLERLRALPSADRTRSACLREGFAHVVEWAAADRALLETGFGSVHVLSDQAGIDAWKPMFTGLIRAAAHADGDASWDARDDDRALVLGHVLTTCLIDLVAGSRDEAVARRTLDTAITLLFD